MPTLERPLEDVHLEVFAPTGGFILGVSVFGDLLGGDAFRLTINKFGDLFSDAYMHNQWVDYINDATTISYRRGSVNEGATNTVQVGIISATIKNAANPLEDYKIRAGRPIRLRHLDEILLSGNITAVPGRITRKKGAYTKYFILQAADTVQRLAALKAYGAGGLTEPYETFEERIARLLDTYTGAVELPTGDAYPTYKLSATVYEGSLASHLDLACNSVGASWYIDKLGQVRFSTALTDYITATFTDGTHTETLADPLHYYGIDIEYDAKNHINYLQLANRGIVEDPNNVGEAIAADTNTLYADVTSVASNSYRDATLATCLYTEGAYTSSLNDRAGEILTAYSTPKPTITKIYFNMQENFNATRLEALHLIEVWHESIKYTLRIAGLSATIDPTRWLIELELVKET